MRTRIVYPEQEKAIYLWRLQDDGSLKKDIIHNYRESTFYHGGYIQYMFKIGDEATPRSVKDVQMDRFLNGRVCSFDGDDKHARQIIDDTLSAKVRKYKEDYDAAIKTLNQFRGSR